MRKTKIICTIGPATKSKETIISLIEKGMDVARLNFSHGSEAEHFELINNIRKAAASLKQNVPIIGDLGGPKVRIGDLLNPVNLGKDEIVILSYETSPSSDYKTLRINYDKLHEDVKIGDKILIDDGLIELITINKSGSEIYCKVNVGGLVRSRKGVNFPDSPLSTPSLTEKDKEDIEFALKNELDFLALSFVRNSNDIIQLRQYLADRKSDIPLIAKIEKPQAIQDIEQIIKSSDAIMIARGDLGVEMSAYEVPILQKEIISKCLSYNVPVITATQMLESMISNPCATRAEVSDVANAVFDGTDAVMLSGETSIGSHPVTAVNVMHSILSRAEQTDYIDPIFHHDSSTITKTQFAVDLSKAACSIAQDTKAAVIIAMTKSGRTARFLSKYRTKIPILAFTPHQETITKLKLSWGVETVLLDFSGNTDETLAHAKEYALNNGLIEKEDIIVFVTGRPISETNEINMIKLEKV
ncbi:MAG: pyruvate kinase [Candidatus Cloacimonetes bacterium]|nr:pyruvate kinase [Candidatus Cloacimonadota bacterium]